jgi:hypothetical protein
MAGLLGFHNLESIGSDQEQMLSLPTRVRCRSVVPGLLCSPPRDTRSSGEAADCRSQVIAHGYPALSAPALGAGPYLPVQRPRRPCQPAAASALTVRTSTSRPRSPDGLSASERSTTGFGPSASRYDRLGSKNLAAPRQPLRRGDVTYVFGTLCRMGPGWMGPGWRSRIG